MAAYNFQKQFVPLIEGGSKQSTIRQRRKNGYLPREGDVLRLYSGMRTKACRLIREVVVARVSPIVVNARLNCADVVLNGVRLNDGEVYEMAKSDGFKGIRDFAEFFESKYGPQLNAYLIEWRPL
jgi:hypothetical protein